MKYLKKFNYTQNNISIHNTQIKEICELNIPDPEHGDLKLSVFPFENNGQWVSLPEGFKSWEESLNKIVEMIPLQEGANTHYITIDSKFFTQGEFLRREGVHADGNFCVDPKFSFANINEKKSWGGVSPKPTWGGVSPKGMRTKPTRGGVSPKGMRTKPTWGGVSPKPTWGGVSPKPTWGGVRIKDSGFDYPHNSTYEAKSDNSHVEMDWVLPYDLVIPVGDYMSESKGGILTVSTEPGCQAWGGTFKGEVLSEGNYEGMMEQLTDDKKVVFDKDKLYFMTSNCPHETLLIDKGKRRTFMRITLNHEYLNEQILK